MPVPVGVGGQRENQKQVGGGAFAPCSVSRPVVWLAILACFTAYPLRGSPPPSQAGYESQQLHCMLPYQPADSSLSILAHVRPYCPLPPKKSGIPLTAAYIAGSTVKHGLQGLSLWLTGVKDFSPDCMSPWELRCWIGYIYISSRYDLVRGVTRKLDILEPTD